ncbi:alanine dehydrogenase, partial [Candidatus Peregrinibacteria bacterium]|nr:alanine dehydrogenase [Candidatus Peregrinibacteria bacterium]
VIKESLEGDGRFAQGLNAYKGFITYKSVAEDLGMMDEYKDLKELVE